MTITGRAPALIVEWPCGVVEPDPSDVDLVVSPHQPHVGHVEARHGEPSNYDWTVKKTQATQALKQLDIPSPAARAFVEEAARQLPRTATLEQLFRGALQRFKNSQPAFVTRSK